MSEPEINNTSVSSEDRRGDPEKLLLKRNTEISGPEITEMNPNRSNGSKSSETSQGDLSSAELLELLGSISVQKELGDLQDLEATLQAEKEAVNLTPPGDADRPGRLENLAISLRDRYQRLGDPEDLGAALQADKEALLYHSRKKQ
ncbi:hypothetical protein MVEN_02614800 [Mycena venus]|uniref:Uncharacterized protein n=1 Tax=Mycena venus TaxID=2733690 RepID=A0A8H6WQY6_9AGAR|nr:hypothetical protein MVEN_02614800 [Mycena venus]